MIPVLPLSYHYSYTLIPLLKPLDETDISFYHSRMTVQPLSIRISKQSKKTLLFLKKLMIS
uniref:Uncharacterized protein n=1 Tax=Utricularia reniformis TaxID=192314 RepID=A0A1Y0B013_9LAMI|nr:hypothetical protein AEK19_MT0520 [Utricularia reniformis]ART30776.1 hypothetical protein AEK19_MT0520 [Utricularia reniformis]